MQSHIAEHKEAACFFCSAINSDQNLRTIPELNLGPFVAAYDQYPVTPGHVLIIPKRHVQYMKDLTPDEYSGLLKAVIATKKYLLDADIYKEYAAMVKSSVAGSTSKPYLERSLKLLTSFNRPPDSFNDGINDGPAAGQTVPHFHWHIMPRWQGDVEDPRGGVRHMFSGLGNYKQGITDLSKI